MRPALSPDDPLQRDLLLVLVEPDDELVEEAQPAKEYREVVLAENHLHGGLEPVSFVALRYRGEHLRLDGLDPTTDPVGRRHPNAQVDSENLSDRPRHGRYVCARIKEGHGPEPLTTAEGDRDERGLDLGAVGAPDRPVPERHRHGADRIRRSSSPCPEPSPSRAASLGTAPLPP